MSLEKPENIIEFPKIKRVGNKFDKQSLKEVIQENILPLKELEAGEDIKASELGKKIKKARPDFEIIQENRK